MTPLDRQLKRELGLTPAGARALAKADALAAFATAKAEIDIMIERLKAMSEEHFGYKPDEINWGHVGTLDHYAELLKRIV